MKKILVTVFLIVGFVILFIPFKKGKAKFENFEDVEDYYLADANDSKFDKNYFFENGFLFVKKQETRHAMILITKVRQMEWSKEKLVDLAKEDDELRSFLESIR